MMDFSWTEFLIVIVVAVLAVGPKQLPEVLHGLGKLFRRMQYMKYALTRQFDDFMDQADLSKSCAIPLPSCKPILSMKRKMMRNLLRRCRRKILKRNHSNNL